MDVSQAKHKRSWEESDRMWTEFSNDSEREKDQMGPECSKLRIECPVKDYAGIPKLALQPTSK